MMHVEKHLQLNAACRHDTVRVLIRGGIRRSPQLAFRRGHSDPASVISNELSAIPQFPINSNIGSPNRASCSHDPVTGSLRMPVSTYTRAESHPMLLSSTDRQPRRELHFAHDNGGSQSLGTEKIPLTPDRIARRRLPGHASKGPRDSAL